jgi:plastocyanin
MDAKLQGSRRQASAIVRIGVFVASAALAGSSIASAAPASQVVKGTVGPGFTITLTLGGQKVTKLKAHTPYRFVIRDRATIHDFHLRGPGIDRVLTDVAFQGTKSYTLTLKKGTYRFFCDPHAGFMKGSFRVA